MDTLPIRYCFTLSDGTQYVFNLQLDANNLELYGNTPEILPSWTNLNFKQCPNCPLTPEIIQHCPLAFNLVNIINIFNELASYDKIHLEVNMEERTISHDTTVQKGISSLMGLVIATCGCPHTAFFKPMARFHMPFAKEEETIYKATSMYLLAQYFLRKKGMKADLDFRGLMEIYKNIQIVNRAIAERIRAVAKTDSTVNALILLDMYAQALPIAIEKSLEKIHYLFTPFFRGNVDYSAFKNKTQ